MRERVNKVIYILIRHLGISYTEAMGIPFSQALLFFSFLEEEYESLASFGGTTNKKIKTLTPQEALREFAPIEL